MKMKNSCSLLLAIVSHNRQRCPIVGNTKANLIGSSSHKHRAIRLATKSSSLSSWSSSSLSSSLCPTHVHDRARIASSNRNDANRIHGGIPIGAVQIAASHAQDFRELVRSTLRTTKNRGVEKFIGPRVDDGNRATASGTDMESPSSRVLLIHVAPDVAAALDDGHPELTDFLKRNSGVYVPGLRRSRTHRQAMRRRRSAILPGYRRKDDRSSAATANDENDATGTKRPTAPEGTFTFSELFAGIGGFRLGLEAIGGTCAMANEIDPYAASIYRHNFEDGGDDGDPSSGCRLIEADILDLCAETDVPADVDILTAGFPCQPFSTRGRQRGFDDDRGQLYRELVRVLRASEPKSFMFENVAGLVSLGGGSARRKEAGPVFRTILEAFEGCGYDVTWKICNSRHFVAQQRERVFIVGTRKDLDLVRPFGWEWYERMLLAEGGGSSNSYNNVDDVNSILSVRDIMEPPDSTAVSESRLSPRQWAKLQNVHSDRPGGVATFASIDIDANAPTLISSYRRSGSHTSKFIFTERDGTARDVPRYLTPRECCRLQGFPEDYDIPSAASGDRDVIEAHFYAGIGNAVVPPVVGSIGKEIIACLYS